MNLVMAEIAHGISGASSLKDIATIPALLAAGNLGGFGVYIAASTSLAAVGSAIGITFPFVAYTTLSRAISIALGPVGWIAAGLYAINKLAGPNDKKLVPAIVYIAGLRSEMSLQSKGPGAHTRKTLIPGQVALQQSLEHGKQASFEELRRGTMLITGASHRFEQ